MSFWDNTHAPVSSGNKVLSFNWGVGNTKNKRTTGTKTHCPQKTGAQLLFHETCIFDLMNTTNSYDTQLVGSLFGNGDHFVWDDSLLQSQFI